MCPLGLQSPPQTHATKPERVPRVSFPCGAQGADSMILVLVLQRRCTLLQVVHFLSQAVHSAPGDALSYRWCIFCLSGAPYLSWCTLPLVVHPASSGALCFWWCTLLLVVHSAPPTAAFHIAVSAWFTLHASRNPSLWSVGAASLRQRVHAVWRGERDFTQISVGSSSATLSLSSSPIGSVFANCKTSCGLEQPNLAQKTAVHSEQLLLLG